MSIHMKAGDLGAVAEVLGWDSGDPDVYEYHEKALDAFHRIKKELRELRRLLKVEQELTNSYMERLHAAESKLKQLEVEK